MCVWSICLCRLRGNVMLILGDLHVVGPTLFWMRHLKKNVSNIFIDIFKVKGQGKKNIVTCHPSQF